MTDPDAGVPSAWAAFVDGLRDAGERIDRQTAGLPPSERADAYRALLRGLNNQLGRFEVDRERPELVFFNGWREKMFMDNPDFRYRVADIRDDHRYRIDGTTGAAAYVSITVYTSGGTLDAAATSRIDSDELAIGDDGSFTVTLARTRPDEPGDWLPLPEGASSVWVRHFHRDVATDELGDCRIEPLDDVEPPPSIEPGRFARHLGRLGAGIASFPSVFDHATRHDLAHPNEVRHWEEMAGGAAFTEPGIHYLRGSWQLGPDEALVLDGMPAPSRYWSILLYSRFLNSLDHRSRRVSATDATATLAETSMGRRYRFALAGRDPGPDRGDWLDTEGRAFGIFVFRFLHPASAPTLPDARVVALADLAAGR